jgi:hypothetical protein
MGACELSLLCLSLTDADMVMYAAEIWGWILFTIGTQTVAAGLFTAAGAFQMAEWANGKHRRLVKVMSFYCRACDGALAC